MVHLMLTELKAEQYALKQGLNLQFRCTVGDMHLTRHTSTGQFLATQQLIRGTSGEMLIQQPATQQTNLDVFCVNQQSQRKHIWKLK